MQKIIIKCDYSDYIITCDYNLDFWSWIWISGAFLECVVSVCIHVKKKGDQL